MVWGFSTHKTPSKSVVLATVIFSLAVMLYMFYSGGSQAKIKSSKELRILCFGDSITRGHVGHFGGEYHPYSLTLKKRLKKQASKRSPIRKIVVYNRGVNGERVCKSMEERLSALLKVRRYDWVIILGGTNDLKHLKYDQPFAENYDRKLYQPILNALLKLHRTVHKHGGKSVVVTIPGRLCELSQGCHGLKTARLWTNERLRKFAAKIKDKVVLADLDQYMSIERYKRYWNDELHLSPKGYDRMGDIIYRALYNYTDSRGKV